MKNKEEATFPDSSKGTEDPTVAGGKPTRPRPIPRPMPGPQTPSPSDASAAMKALAAKGGGTVTSTPPRSGMTGGNVAPNLRPSMDMARNWHPFMQGSQFQNALSQTKDLRQAIQKMPDRDFQHHFAAFKIANKQQLNDPAVFRNVATQLSKHIPINPTTGKLISAQKMPKLGEVSRGNKRGSKIRKK